MREPQTPPEAQRILAERARALARLLDREPESERIDLLVFTVAGERYGVDVRAVHGVHVASRTADVPGVSSLWAGAVSIRGTCYPVLDLPRYLEIGTPQRKPVSVVLLGADRTIGVLAEDIPEVRSVAVEEIRAPLAEGGGGAGRGTTTALVTVLDAEALVNDPRLGWDTTDPGDDRP